MTTPVPKVEHFDQRDVRYYNRMRCSHRFVRYPTSPKPIEAPCKHGACWIVDGEYLCALHAGRKVLPILAGMI